ncbi:hypothetical protein [Bacillus marinisedimentorum]|uniref:hypothetical protein n=1 Tax=Bacillus marinisedimentorum TaxID=1821260 RepID=UPI000872513F|nr:hypothetical protein [Bacillus marinisedimentorum]
MNTLPPLHPEWMISFWYDTPLLNMLNPHYTLAAATVAGILFFFMKKRNGTVEPDADESMFQHLLHRKQVIHEQMKSLDLRRKRGELSLEDYEAEVQKHEELMKKVRDDLQQYL